MSKLKNAHWICILLENAAQFIEEAEAAALKLTPTVSGSNPCSLPAISDLEQALRFN